MKKGISKSLLNKVAMTLLVAALLPFGLSVFLFYMQEKTIIDMGRQQYYKKILELTSIEIDQELYVSLSLGKSLANHCLDHETGKLNEGLYSDFKSAVDYNLWATNITLADKDSKILVSLEADDSRLKEHLSESWFISSLEGTPSFSPVHRHADKDSGVCISISYPVIYNAEVKYVLVIDIALENIWEDIFEIVDNESEYFVLLDEYDRIISYPDEDKILTDNDLFKIENNSVIPLGDKGDNNYEYYYSVIDSSEKECDLGWKIVLVRDMDVDSLIKISTVQHAAVVVIIVFFFILIISYMFARSIVSPIKKVTEAANEIAKGNYNINISYNSGDEIGVLTSAVNNMADNLKHTTASENILAGKVEHHEQIEKQLKAEKDKADRANKAKDEMLACVSHEVRTPLNGIIGYTESLISEITNKDHKVKLKTILNESEHLLCLLNDILDNAKIQAGKLDIDLRPVDLFHLLSFIKTHVKDRAEKKGLDFYLDCADDVPNYIVTDQLRLRQVILNLVSNAVKFTNTGFVRLTVAAERISESDAKLTFCVIDTGIGIEKDKLTNIFDSYVQADSSTSRKYGGTGLGTTISKNIVSLMGGFMDAQSEVGVGSKFWFEIPVDICKSSQIEMVKKEELGSEQLLTENAKVYSKAKVLLVEDYQTNQTLITSQLKRMNIECDLAENGRQAVFMVTKNDYDLILMDLQMPVMDGITATKRIRELEPPKNQVPIVAMTACVEPKIRDNCFEAGMVDIVEKPLKFAKLASFMDKWLNGEIQDENEIKNESGQPAKVKEKAKAEKSQFEVWDKKNALDLFADNQQLLEQAVASYMDNIDQHMNSIRSAIDSEDFETLRSEAHKVSGGASCIAANRINQTAVVLESLAQNSSKDNIDVIYSKLEYLVNELKKEIDEKL